MYNNYSLSHIPERIAKPRKNGITMIMDKGLSCSQVSSMLESGSDYIDIVKFGWATTYVAQNLQSKLDIYKEVGIPVYFGGTLFEAFVIRGQFDDYRRLLDKYKLTHCEVSDGSIEMPQDMKCDYIQRLAKDFTVLSEVGSKDAEKIIPPYKWIQMMQAELDAGSSMIIGEAREAGNVGLFRANGEVRSGLVEEILTKIPSEKILWEAPQKSQQVYFIKLCGQNVNLGNIATNEAISLETIRLGLRGDTFDLYLDGMTL